MNIEWINDLFTCRSKVVQVWSAKVPLRHSLSDKNSTHDTFQSLSHLSYLFVSILRIRYLININLPLIARPRSLIPPREMKKLVSQPAIIPVALFRIAEFKGSTVFRAIIFSPSTPVTIPIISLISITDIATISLLLRSSIFKFGPFLSTSCRINSEKVSSRLLPLSRTPALSRWFSFSFLLRTHVGGQVSPPVCLFFPASVSFECSSKRADITRLQCFLI